MAVKWVSVSAHISKERNIKMSILQPLNHVDKFDTSLHTARLRDNARCFNAYDMNVIPIQSQSKAAAIEWKSYCEQPQTPKEVIALPWSQNIAVISGPGDIRVIDLDGCSDTDILFQFLTSLGLDHEYQWVAHTPGKGGGFQIYIKCPENLSLTEKAVLVGKPFKDNLFEQLELRWHDCYSLMPPSIHPDTKTAYTWAFGKPITSIATVSLTLIEKTFLAFTLHQDKALQAAPSSHKKNHTIIKETRKDVWAQKALVQELEILQNTIQNRNDQLNKSAYNLGQIIGSKCLEREEVEISLTRIANMIGLENNEIANTIKSGINSGIKQPRLPKQIFKANEPPLQLPKIKNINEEQLASFTADDQGNAEAVYSLYGQYIAFNNAFGWLIWDGTHFSPSQQRINTLIVETLRLRMQAARHLERSELAKVSKAMAGTVSACRSMLENIAVINEDEFDNEPDLINVANGVVDLRSKTLYPHSPEYHFTWCSPVKYNPHADRTIWLEFMKDTLNTQEMIDYLQQALGYSITGHTSEECLFYIYGPPRSGKGSMTECILCIFPRPITLEVDFNTFTSKREGDNQNFDLAPLKAARIVFASESNKYQSLNPAKVKALTGGNLVQCAFKHKDFFSYKPQYAVWLSSNHEVNGDVDDDALWGRVKVVPFPNSRLGSEDKTLKMRLQSPEVLEGVLSFLVDGAALWYEYQGRGLITPDTVKQVTQQQRSAQDSVGQWLEECCEFKEGEWTENTKVRLSYDNWCESNGYEPKKAKGLAQSLVAHGYEVAVIKWITNSQGLKGKAMRGVNNLFLL